MTIPDQVTALAEERGLARVNKDFVRSDQLRDADRGGGVAYQGHARGLFA